MRGSFVRGNTVFLNPLAPSGTLDYNYQMPYGSVTVALYKGLSYKMAWNYYGFNETGNTAPFGLSRYTVAGFQRQQRHVLNSLFILTCEAALFSRHNRV